MTATPRRRKAGADGRSGRLALGSTRGSNRAATALMHTRGERTRTALRHVISSAALSARRACLRAGRTRRTPCKPRVCACVHEHARVSPSRHRSRRALPRCAAGALGSASLSPLVIPPRALSAPPVFRAFRAPCRPRSARPMTGSDPGPPHGAAEPFKSPQRRRSRSSRRCRRAPRRTCPSRSRGLSAREERSAERRQFTLRLRHAERASRSRGRPGAGESLPGAACKALRGRRCSRQTLEERGRKSAPRSSAAAQGGTHSTQAARRTPSASAPRPPCTCDAEAQRPEDAARRAADGRRRSAAHFRMTSAFSSW